MNNILVHFTLVDTYVEQNDPVARLVLYQAHRKLREEFLPDNFKTKILHHFNDDISVSEFISNNWKFQPIYENLFYDINLSKTIPNEKNIHYIPFPEPIGKHGLEILDFGKHQDINIYGFRTIKLISSLNHDVYRASVAWSLDTCRGIVDDSILEFLHNSFIKYGYKSDF